MQIVAVESVGPGKRARRIRFEDGSERITSASVVKELVLEEGSAATRILVDIEAVEPEHARQRALALLGYRDRSVAELERKLLDDGYPRSVAHEVVEAYIRVGLLDDERYAREFARAKSAAGFGRSRIRRELTSNRGIEASTADAALDESCGVEDELDRAKAALRGARPANRKEYEKLLRRLVGKGFDFGVAKRALEVESSEIAPDCEPFDSEF